MLQSTKKITQKYKRQLKTEDFLILTQQNQQYQQIINIMVQKQNILNHKISEMQKYMDRLQNEKEQFKLKCTEYLNKIINYEIIRQSLSQEYQLLKKQIQHNINTHKHHLKQTHQTDKKLDQLQQINLSLQLQIKKKDLIIQQLRNHLAAKQKQILQNKIQIFANLIDSQSTAIETVPQTNKALKKKENSLLNSNVPSHTPSNNISKLNSISFSLQSNESHLKSKKSSSSHNKSIFI